MRNKYVVHVCLIRHFGKFFFGAECGVLYLAFCPDMKLHLLRVKPILLFLRLLEGDRVDTYLTAKCFVL